VRLFVAVNFPAELRERLWTAAAPLRTRDVPVRWVPAADLHLTLKFLGETAEGRLDELDRALAEAVTGVRSLAVTVDGFGAFPNLTHPSVVWAGVLTDPALELLQHGVEKAFGPLGFPPEGRPFRPHVTLGRARRGTSAAAFRGLDAVLEDLAWSETVTVQSIELMASTPGRAKANDTGYEELRHGRLS
jgi:2'-5' RNA ligase